MIFGPTTVTFVKVTEDASNRDRYGNPAQTTTQTDVTGCLFRPVNFREQNPSNTQKVFQRWKCTAPPVPAVLATVATDEVIVNGVTYQVIAGVETFSDFNGLYKCTIYCELQLL